MFLLKTFNKKTKKFNVPVVALTFLDILFTIIPMCYLGSIFMKSLKLPIKMDKIIRFLRFGAMTGIKYVLQRQRSKEFMSKIKLPNWIIAGANVLFLIGGVILVIVDPSILSENIGETIMTIATLLGINVYPCFNNATKTQKDIENKELKKSNAKNLKLAKKEAKKELKEKQKQELNALTNKKLDDLSKQEENVEVKSESTVVEATNDAVIEQPESPEIKEA